VNSRLKYFGHFELGHSEIGHYEFGHLGHSKIGHSDLISRRGLELRFDVADHETVARSPEADTISVLLGI
jgi:hypothetical protein